MSGLNVVLSTKVEAGRFSLEIFLQEARKE
jgi:hypothetical protein